MSDGEALRRVGRMLGRDITREVAPAVLQENKTEISEWYLDQLWARLPLVTKKALLFPERQ